MFRGRGNLSDRMDNVHCRPKPNATNNDSYRLRFDHCNHAMYYETTRVLLQPILDNLNVNYLNDDGYAVAHDSYMECDKIEHWYQGIVGALTQAASVSVPRVKCGALKHFWDDELSELKRLSINSHSMWVEAERPKSGDIYLNRTRSKFKYKAAINERKLA